MTIELTRSDIATLIEDIHDALIPNMLPGEGFDRSNRLTPDGLDILSRFSTHGNTPAGLLVKVNSEEGTVTAEFSRFHLNVDGTVNVVSACKFPVHLGVAKEQIKAGFEVLTAHPESQSWDSTRFTYLPSNYEFIA